MNIQQKRKILEKISQIEKDIEKLECTRQEIASSPYTSASTSSGTGSKSYSKMSISQINDAILVLKKELRSYRRLLSGNGSITSTTYIIYS